MDMQEWAQFISSVGFPIVACCGMFYLYNKTISEITTTLSLMNKTLNDLANRLERLDESETMRKSGETS